MDKKPSEYISEFLEFLEKSKEEHESAYTEVGAEDRVQLYENPYKFYTDQQNQNLIKRLRRLQNEQKQMENYLFVQREFKNRVD